MKEFFLKSNGIFLCFLLFFGCSRPKQENDALVQRIIQERLCKTVHWNQGCPEDEQVSEAILRLLNQDLTVDSTVQVALLNNPNIQVVFEEIGIAQADLVQAGLLKNPIFDTYFRFPNKSSLGLNTAFSLVMNFVDLFLMPLRKRTATLELEKAKIHVTDAIFNLALDVEKAFYAYQGKRSVYELQKTLLETADAAALLAERQNQVGNVNPLFYFSKQADREQIFIDLQNIERDLKMLREQLNVLMGLPKDSQWEIEDYLPDIEHEKIALEGLEEKAMSMRLDICVARKEVQVICSAGAQKKWWAYTDLQLGVSTEREAEGFWETGPSLTLALPFFDWGQGARARLYAMLVQSREKYKALEVEVRAQVRQSYQNLSSYREIVELFTEKILPLREKILKQSQKQYNYMAFNLYEMLMNKQELIRAQINYEMALKEYWSAYAEIVRAVGGKLM